MKKYAGDAPKSRRKHSEPGPALTLEVIERIERARVAKNWTYADLERQSGVDTRTIQSWLERAARERAASTKPLRPRLLAHVLQALDIGARLVRRPDFPARRLDSLDVFLAAPMESLGDAYHEHRAGMLQVLNALRATLGLSVFYAGEDRPLTARFEDEAWALADNVDILERSGRFLLIYPPPLLGYGKPLASSALIEIGYAIAIRLPVLVFFQQSFDTLPFLLRMLPSVFECSHLVRYRGIDDILEAVTTRERRFFARAAPSYAPPD